MVWIGEGLVDILEGGDSRGMGVDVGKDDEASLAVDGGEGVTGIVDAAHSRRSTAVCSWIGLVCGTNQPSPFIFGQRAPGTTTVVQVHGKIGVIPRIVIV